MNMHTEKQLHETETAIRNNIGLARAMNEQNESVRTVIVVSGSDTDREEWNIRFGKTGRSIFNADGSTRILSFREKTGQKTREGNFLGTLLAYRQLARTCDNGRIHPYRDGVTLVGMLFGRGERISPFTQIEGGRKPAICVGMKIRDDKPEPLHMTALEEALFYFAPVARDLESRGFCGMLDKWGDETEIASIDLSAARVDAESLADHDIVKFVSRIPITDELALQKDWVVSDRDGRVKTLIARNSRESIIRRMMEYGIEADPDGVFRAGVSLGPVAVSWDFLDIANSVFEEDLIKDGVFLDFDPYVLMALSHTGTRDEWDRNLLNDRGYAQIVSMMPDFHEKLVTCRQRFEDAYGRALNFRIYDMGDAVYWADIGQHATMRQKFMLLNAHTMEGRIARMIERLPEGRDADGNIIVASRIDPGITVRNSVIVGSTLTGNGVVESSVIKHSTIRDPRVNGAFVVLSVRAGGPVELVQDSGLYRSIGNGRLCLSCGERHGTLLLEHEALDMVVSEQTDLRDRRNYDRPIFTNTLSFRDAFDRMFGTGSAALASRRAALITELTRRDA